jgi:hypothetical protein
MSEYPGYKNRATFVASVCLSESIKTLRDENPNMSVLDVKRDCLEFLLERSSHRIVCQFIHVVADDIDWDFLYTDSMTIKAHQ